MITLYRSSYGLFILIALLLTACTTTPVGPVKAVPAAPHSAHDWLDKARGAPPAERAGYLLNAARLFYQQGDIASAEQSIAGIDRQSLRGTSIADYLSLSAEIMASRAGPGAAADWLNMPAQANLLEKTSPQKQAPVYLLLAELQNDAGRFLDAVNTRIVIAPYLGPQARLDNQQQLWDVLMHIPPSQVTSALQRASDSQVQLRGWLELALVALDNQGYIDEQRVRLEDWERAWPNHPARQPLPEDMALLKTLDAGKTAQIAVLLPASGRLKNAGSAVRDGLMLAYFDARARGASVPPLAFYDTEATDNVRALYRKAVSSGAELVIGPLSKERVRALSTLKEMSVPVLALNYTDENYPSNDNFYQFGISNTDDAALAAERARQLRYQRVLIIHGMDKSGTRTAEAFEEAWKMQDGEIAAVIEFESEQTASNEIRNGLHVQRSKKRAQIVESAIGESLEATPRRRQDLDFVYLPVNFQQARSIKPLLAFHFAQDLPTYASSRVYRGKVDINSDSDLNGIIFTDTPWALGAVPQKAARIENYVQQGAAPSKNLYALGIDAFHMVPRVALMANSPSARFSGLTGTLMVSNRGLIIRRPSWAVFRQGKANLIEEQTHDSADVKAESARDD